MDVLMYLRKSRAEELHDTTEETLRRHKEQLVALAQRMGLHIILTFEEVVSGESLYARPQMLKMLEAVSTGNYSAVLVMDVDRLGRGSMAEQGIIMDTFRRFNVKIITPDKTIDLCKDSDEEHFEIESLFARRELKIIKKRLHRGIQKSVEEGAYLANAPYGYHKAVVDRHPTLEIYEPEAFYIRMIFDLYVNQGVGTESIARQLNALGAHPARSDKFSRGSVAYIIKNPVYAGKTVWDKQHYVVENGVRHSYPTPERKKVTNGIHPPIIDEETFCRAQEIIDKKWHKKYFDGTVQNPLAGLVYCGNCGNLMVRHPAGKRTKIPFLMCRNPGCIPTHPTEEVEAAVLANLREQLAVIDANVANAVPPDVTAYDNAISAAERELKNLASQLSKTYDLLERSVYDVDTFLDRRNSINERTEFLKKFIVEQQDRKQAVLESDQGFLAQKTHSVLDVYEASDAAQKNALLRMIIAKIVYSKTGRKRSDPFNVLVILKNPPTWTVH
ncbi:MAG: recombinase family protein [Ruminococcaceae bacterium]|nr:recombinase family protein [Oscillospiraceae bacterium]